MIKDIPSVFFVFHVLIACGMKDDVVIIAAANPKYVNI
jgi:hypothetical protein